MGRNLIYIHTHDLGRYIGTYGFPVDTPNIDRLAASGIAFSRAFSAGPTCSPSRCALLTGQWPHNAGMYGLANMGFRMPSYERHIVQQLNGRGFETVLAGVQHEAQDSSMIGYQRALGGRAGETVLYESETAAEVLGVSDEWDRRNAKQVAAYLTSPPERPFFLSFGMGNAHREFSQVSPETDPDRTAVPPPQPATAATRADFTRFVSSVRAVDECVGIVLEALSSSPARAETTVVFTTDHGPAFPGMKCTLKDAGIGVALVLSYLGIPDPGRVCHALVSQIDLLPTLYDILREPVPEWSQGRSLVPLIERKTESHRSEVYAELNYHIAYEPARCVRTDRYKYIRHFGDYQFPIGANVDDGPTKDFVLSAGFLERRRASVELFDLYFDPAEACNVAERSEYAEVLEHMETLLSSWMRETDDPLLSGPIAQPEGTTVYSATCVSHVRGDYLG